MAHSSYARRTSSWRAASSAFVLAVASVFAAGCGGGSGGGGSSLEFVGAVAEGLGVLPQSNVFLNNRITVRFNNALDPSSVSTQTFRVLEGPDFVELAPGEIGVAGDTITFIPQLPRELDFSDSGFQSGTTYRIVLRGLPDLNTLRSRNGKPLAATSTVEFTTRSNEPLFTDLVAGSPRVIGVLVDLDGSGTFEADGDPATPEAEEFFEGEVDFGSPIPFVTGVPLGSVSLPAPNAPLMVGFLYNEPLSPSSVFVDGEDLNGDGVPEGDGEFDSFVTEDLTNAFACDDPFPGDMCPRPVDFDLTLEQFFVAERETFFVLVTMQYAYALRPLARHRILASRDVTDFIGNDTGRDFDARFESGADAPPEDFFFEDFSGLDRRSSATSAHWNPVRRPYLAAGIGFGGDGSDGIAIEPDDAMTTIDTRGNSGVFNFSSFEFPPVSDYLVRVVGDKPAILRIQGRLNFTSSTEIIRADGEAGLGGAPDSVAPRPGGAGGPGGFDGGSSSPDGADTIRGEDGLGPEGFDDAGGEGGESALGPGGGGGGANAFNGAAGGRGGGDDVGQGGAGGTSFADDVTELVGGSGGGAGGNNNGSSKSSPGSSGGAGGGGGGALVIEVDGDVRLGIGTGGIFSNGGVGGNGALFGDFRSGGGGGGGGGTIIIRARRFSGLTGQIEALGGANGAANGTAGRGGRGGAGRIRLESIVTRTCPNCDPEAEIVQFDDSMLGKSVGRSAFLLTNASEEAFVEYSFAGNDPFDPMLPGRVVFGSGDIRVLDPDGFEITTEDDLPSNATIQIFFRAAMEDPLAPNTPDEETITEWVTDVTELNGFPMIQWEVRFDIGPEIDSINPENDPPMPAVDDLRVHFQLR